MAVSFIKKSFIYLFALFVASLFLDSRTVAQSLPSVEARKVAASVQSFYDQTKSVSARFVQDYFYKLYKRTDRSSGRVIFMKPGRMRWDYDQPNGKIITSDGENLLVYEPGDGDEKGQVYEQRIDEAQLPQAMAFLMGIGRLEKNFTFRLLDSNRKLYPGGYILELRPTRPSPLYDHILFYVESDPRLRGLVRRVVIIDPNGNQNRFGFSQFKFNRQVPLSKFRFEPPKGTRLVNP